MDEVYRASRSMQWVATGAFAVLALALSVIAAYEPRLDVLALAALAWGVVAACWMAYGRLRLTLSPGRIQVERLARRPLVIDLADVVAYRVVHQGALAYQTWVWVDRGARRKLHKIWSGPLRPPGGARLEAVLEESVRARGGRTQRASVRATMFEAGFTAFAWTCIMASVALLVAGLRQWDTGSRWPLLGASVAAFAVGVAVNVVVRRRGAPPPRR